jgi:two-component system response regulator
MIDRCKAANILLVEDNPDHAELTLRGLRSGNMLNKVFWVKDGAEALDFLYQRGRYGAPEAAPRPGLILLDIKLPKVDGHEVLRTIKQDDKLRSIPVVMLTTSGQSDDVSESYSAGVNSFITKPVSFREFVEKIKTVKMYWVLTNVPAEA